MFQKWWISQCRARKEGYVGNDIKFRGSPLKLYLKDKAWLENFVISLMKAIDQKNITIDYGNLQKFVECLDKIYLNFEVFMD